MIIRLLGVTIQKFQATSLLDLFVGLVVWCKLKSADHKSLLVVVVFGIFCGIPNVHHKFPLKTYA